MSSSPAPDQEFANCWNCRRSIQYTGNIDPQMRWVHTHSGNCFCSVVTPADAVTLQDKQFQPVAVPLSVPLQRSNS